MEKMSIGRTESINFYKYLCKKIGSMEVVRTRRLAFTITDIGLGGKTITSGSKSEGLNLNGSDLDIMIIDSSFKVYQSDTEVQSQCFAVPLILNTEETHPCFTQLRFLPHNIEPIPKILEKNHRGRMVSSELYKQCIKKYVTVKTPTLFYGKIHGPCISNRDDTLDVAWCLKCDKWISQAEPWVSRPRTTWPSHEIISKIVSSGVLFVPIGCKGSINEHLEWRFSFSVAEKCLIFSFSHTQLLCYAMLKIMQKEIVEKHEDLKGFLCSYFLKTLLFWIFEETDQYLWRPDNVIPCFMACLQRLMYCVRYSILSHYFIPDNNLFFLRFNTNDKEKIITMLNNLYEEGINFLAFSETLRNFKSQSHKSTESLISRNSSFLQQIIPTFWTIRYYGRPDRVLGLFNFLRSSRTALSKDLFALQISEAFMLVPEKTQYPNSSGNKHHYFSYKQDLSHLVLGLHSDAVSGWLKLASFFYVHKNYAASLTVIAYTLPKFTYEKIYTRFFGSEKAFTHIQKHVLNLMKKEKLHTVIKSLTIHRFSFNANSSIIPKELQPDVASKPNVFHPLYFAHFLTFLCYYHLHDIPSCRQSLQRLEQDHWILSDADTIVFLPVSLNKLILCGIGYQLMGQADIARRAFQEAAIDDKYNQTSAASRLFSMTS